MGLWDTLTGWVKKDSKKYMYVSIPAGHVVGGDYSQEAMEDGKHYFRLWLTEMYLKSQRAWFATWHPAVHSLVRFQFGSSTVEIPHVAGAMHLKDVNDANLDRSVQLNFNLTTLMPFNGGVVELTAGLLAMQGQNYMKSVLKVMGDLSGMLVVPQLSAALAIAEPIASGVQELLSGGSGQLDLGLHQSFTSAGGGGANDLRPGYFAVLLTEDQQLDKNQLWVKEDRLCHGAAADSAKLLKGVTHMLFRIEGRTERDDWRGLSTITDAFEGAIKALGEGYEDQADAHMRRCLALVRVSSDLTRADRTRVALALKEEYKEAKDIGLGAIPAEMDLAKQIRKRAIGVDEALARPEPTLNELFDLS